jgi:predicted nucleotidyltransferase component of viral defense system
MSNKIIEERLKNYKPLTAQEAITDLKEIFQHIALLALSRAGFFKLAAFQGGTCLRFCHNLARFSEDLDFILINPDKSFSWQTFRSALEAEFAAYELDLKIQDRTKATAAVKSAFLKSDSFGKILSFTPHFELAPQQTVSIKIEIDSNPPKGSQFETHFLNFPISFSLTTRDLQSLFASKCHALLCRKDHKGRDWYDFLWYALHSTSLNYLNLEEALNQYGPWAGHNVHLTKEWLLNALKNRVQSLDIEQAQKDVVPFLHHQDQEITHIWTHALFLDCINKLAHYLPER